MNTFITLKKEPNYLDMCSKFELLEAQYFQPMWHESINIFTDHTAILFQCHRYDSHLMMDHLHRGATSVSLERCTRTPFLRFHSTRRQHTSTSTIIHSANDTTSGYKKQSTIYPLFFYCPIVWCPFSVVGCWLLCGACRNMLFVSSATAGTNSATQTQLPRFSSI